MHCLVVAGETCSVRLEADDFTLQDVLPGRESKLRKQRVYVMHGLPAKSFNARSEWMLAVDSVLIPLRVRAEENGACGRAPAILPSSKRRGDVHE